MIIIDPRETGAPKPEDVPDYAWVPLAAAHMVVSIGRATVYRWYAQDRIRALEIGTDTGGEILHVKAAEVRELYRHFRSKRHAERHRSASETVR